MSNAAKDQNGISTRIAVLNTDGATIIPIRANPTTGALEISDGTTGTYMGLNSARRDENDVPTMVAVSSVDGTTLISLSCDSNGNLLVKSS